MICLGIKEFSHRNNFYAILNLIPECNSLSLYIIGISACLDYQKPGILLANMWLSE